MWFETGSLPGAQPPQLVREVPLSPGPLLVRAVSPDSRQGAGQSQVKAAFATMICCASATVLGEAWLGRWWRPAELVVMQMPIPAPLLSAATRAWPRHYGCHRRRVWGPVKLWKPERVLNCACRSLTATLAGAMLRQQRHGAGPRELLKESGFPPRPIQRHAKASQGPRIRVRCGIGQGPGWMGHGLLVDCRWVLWILRGRAEGTADPELPRSLGSNSQ